MSVQVAFSPNMHFSLGLGLSLVCKTRGQSFSYKKMEYIKKKMYPCIRMILFLKPTGQLQIMVHSCERWKKW